MKKIPVGIDDFEKLRKDNCYYVDKTVLLAELLPNVKEVTLFTRPRRFGKTLTMSMLKCFLESGGDPSLFEGLAIMDYPDVCGRHMGKYPVVCLSLKDVAGLTYEKAMRALAGVIENELARLEDRWHIFTGSLLNDIEKNKLAKLLKTVTDFSGSEANPKREREHYASTDFTETIKESLKTLTQTLEKHCGVKAVLLVDEYDVPLEKANQRGYYAEMVDIIRDMFSRSMKTNGALAFAVLTGCLRVSKESIFTGLNNPTVHSITGTKFTSSFGFTEDETQELMAYYGLGDRMSDATAWYNGYQFANSRMYNPWDILSFADDITSVPDAEPQAYWMNSSGNAIIRQLADMSNSMVRDEIALLIEGGSIMKQVNQQLTYSELYSSADNVFSVMFMTGYLTAGESLGKGVYMLSIPNESVRCIFSQQVTQWFAARTAGKRDRIEALSHALMSRNVASATSAIDTLLVDLISVRDYATADNSKEGFYHGFLLGALAGVDGLEITSNRESGLGYYDITVLYGTGIRSAYILEVKYAGEASGLDSECRQAIKQIRGKQYAHELEATGICEITAYGVAFHKKQCRIISEKL